MTTTNLWVGRNINKDEKGYYIAFSDADLESSHSKNYTRRYFTTYNEALMIIRQLIKSGSTWFDAHFDPTI